MYKIYLTDFPLPYSVNEGLIRNRYTHKFIKTAVAREYDNRVKCWAARMGPENISKLKWIQDSINEGYFIKADYYFLFHIDRVFWKKKKTPRPLDVDNRIKPLQDSVAEIANVNDTYFKKGHREIIAVDREEDQCAIIVLSKTKISQCKTKEQALQKIQAGILD